MAVRTIFISLVLFLILPLSSAVADVPPAVPVTSVQSESLDPVYAEPTERPPAPEPENPFLQKFEVHPVIPERKPQAPLTAKPYDGDSLVVMELFSSQACTFCPKADALIKQFADEENIIALSCHVDYFDVKEGSLALPFCSSRQSAYELSLDIGPKYTPQIVINGRYDAVGYRVTEIEAALAAAETPPIIDAKVHTEENDIFRVDLPDLTEGREYKIWLLVYVQPKNVTVSDGGNRGKNITYYNVVSNAGFLGKWNGRSKSLKFNPKLSGDAKGFAFIVQDGESGQIVIAAKYES